MAVPIRSKAYHDQVGRGRHFRRYLKRGFLILVAGGGLLALALVLLNFSWFAVSDIQVSGADIIGNDRVHQDIADFLSQRQWHFFRPAHNILVLRRATVGQYLARRYAAIGQVDVAKHYPHTLTVEVTERQPIGAWCRGQECQFFDAQGIRWGQALRSSGPLLLLIDDERSDDSIAPKLLQGILATLDGLPRLGLSGRSITLPDGQAGQIIIRTAAGYDIYLDAFGDVSDQLQVLGVFLADRAKDPAFAPTYLDLRTPGRVYYK